MLPSKCPYVHACVYKIYSYTMETMVIIFLYEASTSYCKLTASTMLNPYMSCLENSVNPNHVTCEKPADQELH